MNPRVEAACQRWIKRLTDSSRNNRLLYYRQLSRTVDLTNAKADSLRRLYHGSSVPLSKLLEDYADQQNKVRDAARRARSNREEKGIDTLALGIGSLTWEPVGGEHAPDAVALLLPVMVESQGGNGRLSLKRSGEIRFSSALLITLNERFGIDLNEEGLMVAEDPSALLQLFCAKLQGLPGVRLGERVVLENFAFPNMEIVNDLKNCPQELSDHPLISAIAGEPSCVREVGPGGPITGFDSTSLDAIDPDQEHLVLDADPSQQHAILQVMRGRDLVIQGPPGTGKSQTIANLLAALAAEGKKVLFVAEKRAALEVVKHRLQEAGLEHLVLDLHGPDVTRKSIAARIDQALNRVGQWQSVQLDKLHQDFRRVREELCNYHRKVAREREPHGLSAHGVFGQLLRLRTMLPDEPSCHAPGLEFLELSQKERVCRLLEQLAQHADLLLGRHQSPWNGARLASMEDANSAVSTVAIAAQHLGELRRGLGRYSMIMPTNLAQLDEVIGLLVDISTVRETFVKELLADDLHALEKALAAAGRGFMAWLFASLFSGEYRRAKKQLLRYRLNRRVTDRALLAELHLASATRSEWSRWSSEDYPLVSKQEAEQVRQIGSGFSKALTDARGFCPLSASCSDLADIEQWLSSLARDHNTPSLLAGLSMKMAEIKQICSFDLMSQLQSQRPDTWSNVFEYLWLHACRQAILRETPELASLTSGTMEKLMQEFQHLDEKRFKQQRPFLARMHATRVISALNAYPEQDRTIRGEAKRRGGHRAFRSMLRDAGDVLLTLFPCVMASPLSVSSLMDSQRRFDYVIFDEASQVKTEEAIPAIMRGHHLVVAGDSKQLPPTTFFADGSECEDEEESNFTTEGFESLLDQVIPLVPSCCLTWHYRSASPELIRFSDKHFYDEQLVYFPGSKATTAISHVYVEHQQDVDETSADREVTTVVDLIMEHSMKREAGTLGVITLGLKHANRLRMELDRRLDSQPDESGFFSITDNERFFVKSIEQVQGDERDVIILSMGHGLNQHNKLRMTFGPINRAGGERRLNVAITRAKQRMLVVSSFKSIHMQARAEQRGLYLLQQYLQYAEQGGRLPATRQSIDVELNPFECDVRSVLDSRKIRYESQVKVGQYRLDFAVKHPDRPGQNILVIECDGASYHSSTCARERDRLRQKELERKGWTFHRIWSTDWFNRRAEEVESLMRSYQAALDASNEQSQPGARSVKKAEDEQSTSGLASECRRPPRPIPTKRATIDKYDWPELIKLAQWYLGGELRTDEQIVAAVRTDLGFKRRGNRIDERLHEALRRAKGRNCRL